MRNMSFATRRPLIPRSSSSRNGTPWSSSHGMELHRNVAAIAAALRGLGVAAGDRVVAYVPTIPEAVIAFLACASIGAIWSSCSPDFGSAGVIDRFQQIAPKVLVAVDEIGRAHV